MRINKHGGSVRRTGRWVVPRRLELRSSRCDVILDFTNAVITRDTLRIDMNVRGGSLILLARPGTVVDADSLTVGYTTSRSAPAPGLVHGHSSRAAGWPYVLRPDRDAVALTPLSPLLNLEPPDRRPADAQPGKRRLNGGRV